MSDHHWEGRKPNPDKYFGFIYLITNTLTGRKYIGKKQYFHYRKVKKAGSKRRETQVNKSGWESYTGSSVQLNADIEEFGKENFTFKIIKNYNTKGGLYYAEVHNIITRRCLLSDEWYNGNCPAVKFVPKEMP